MKLPSVKSFYLIGFLCCAAALGGALYLEYSQALAPCPLCQLQRIALGIIGALFFTALFFNPSKLSTKIYGVSISFFGIIGMLLAGRQIYLQHLPANSMTGECIPGLRYLFSIMPVREALKTAIKGSSNCADVLWKFLGLNLAEWTFIIFTCLLLLALWQIKRVKQRY